MPSSAQSAANADSADVASLRSLFERQRAAQLADGAVPARVRVDRIDRCIDLLVSHQRELCEAADSDFGQRPAVVTRAMDILPSVLALKHARSKLHEWMRPQRRGLRLPLFLPGARARIVYQPLGVVGVISPWNFPIGLSFAPLAGILAAGNRCLIKPSELTPATSALMQRLVSASFDSAELAVATGGPQLAEQFSRLPFDHLLFTGSAPVARRIVSASAEHLVPLTLELGGKCPVVVGRSADMARAIDRILIGKLANAGQVCLAPDYVYVPRESVDDFVQQAQAWTKKAYPGLPANADYTSIINARHAARLEALMSDALANGARVVSLGAAPDDECRRQRLFPPALVLGVTDDMRVMQEEIFGPLLPLWPYDRIEEVVSHLSGRARPLALYHFASDIRERDEVLAHTLSGGVTLNDVVIHYLAEDLPFGGVGESGMGAYHGEHGFRRFSHTRAVLKQTRFDVAGIAGLRPPYGSRLASTLKWLIRR